jgi:hypothetical protein
MLKQIANKVLENTADSFKYDTKEHLKTSHYFVEQIKYETGKVAFFDFDYELTTNDFDTILEMVFA